MLILGIETSCDDTSASVVEEGKRILSNIVSSQEEFHKRFGGVVPEIASRKHVEFIIPTIRKALEEADISLDDIHSVAVTQGPGLMGSLLVGISVAKAIAYSKKIPLIGINHLEGHISAIHLEEKEVPYPQVALVVSGGHTVLYVVWDFGNYQFLGGTRDDAAGEAMDKIANWLGLGYPGGAIIDKLAKEGNPKTIEFPRAWISKDSFEFSFSGLKTAVINFLAKDSPGGNIHHIMASFQEAIVDVLIIKAVNALKKYDINTLVVCGGVAANSRLRQRLCEISQEEGFKILIPSAKLCTDNGAMIAAAGYYALKRGAKSNIELEAIPSLHLM